ncbi:MAG TPA: YsnF/AvaK domain-containing protein [Chloroflexota bacterium]|nr:YsnF/AvaK domain-containing protein [Chloroflexota bacterium]
MAALWEDAQPRYKSTCEQRHPGRWKEHEPYYRYGWELRNRPEYQDRPWTDVEQGARRDWETRYPQTRWDEAREHVRYGWEGDGEGVTVQLKEEELIPRTERVEAGAVEVHKNVVTDQRSVEVPVTREEVIVERYPADRRPADRPVGSDADATIRVSVEAERAGVEKRTVVTEEIEIGKRRVQQTERVSDTVRKEVAEIETEGDVEVDRR